MWLNIVTDDQLLASQIVKTILLLVISGGILFNIYRLVKFVSKRKRAINLSILIILCLALIFVVRVYLIEFALLKSPVYVTGTTIGNCNVFAEGRGIEFEYEVNGKKYRNCNTFHPVSPDSIKVPGGRYWVRASNRFPDKGRMDFNKRAN
ncbi:MAG: hypothetical protein JST57_09985 [Bacteroidetes bacterium]|nr:hypothetical protein [Bacteroidota bacterium]